MPNITLTDPVAGTVVASGLIATNNGNLRTLLNSGLDPVNLKGNPALVSGEVPVWNGAQFVRSSVTNIGPSSLGSGSPSSANFLRGDGTWASPGGSGGNAGANVGSANTDLAAPSAPLYYYGVNTGGGTLRSIGAPTAVGSLIEMKNVSASFVTLKHNLAGGTGVSLSIIGAGDKYLAPGQSIQFVYDGTNWVEINRPAQELIADLTLGGSQASFDTNTILGGNIPAVYNTLKLILLIREDDAITLTNALLRFNNDSAANYNLSNVQGNNNVTAASQNVGLTSHNDILSLGASSGAGKFATTEILIPAYAQTTAQKVHTGTTHADASDTAANLMTRAISGTWKNTAAINRIQVLPNAGNFVAGSRFSLYGLT